MSLSTSEEIETTKSQQQQQQQESRREKMKRTQRLLRLVVLACIGAFGLYGLGHLFGPSEVSSPLSTAQRTWAPSGKKGWHFPSNFQKDLPSSTPPSLRLAEVRSTLDAALLAAHRRATVPGTRIPQIVHQTWKSYDTTLKGHVHHSAHTWSSMNSQVIHLLWNDTDIEELVRKFYPSYYSDFVRLPKIILKADIMRYLVLEKFGGIYGISFGLLCYL